MISGALTVVACLLIRAVNAIESHLQYSVSAVLALFAVAAIIFCFWGHKTRVQIESDDDDEEEGGVPTSRRSLWKTFSENSRKRAGSFFGFDDTGDHTGASAADGHADTNDKETVCVNDDGAAMNSGTADRRSWRKSFSQIWRNTNGYRTCLLAERTVFSRRERAFIF